MYYALVYLYFKVDLGFELEGTPMQMINTLDKLIDEYYPQEEESTEEEFDNELAYTLNDLQKRPGESF